MELPQKGEVVPLSKIKEICEHHRLNDIIERKIWPTMKDLQNDYVIYCGIRMKSKRRKCSAAFVSWFPNTCVAEL